MSLLLSLPPRVLLGRVLTLRWLLAASWIAGLSWLEFIVGVDLATPPLVAVLSLLLVFALATVWRLKRGGPVGEGEAVAHLFADLLALAALAFFSGGVTNPFASLMLAPVVLASLSLPARPVWGLAAVASLAYGGLLFQFVPLPIADPVLAYGLHLGGMWFNFMISAALVAVFVTRTQASLRERERQIVELREKQLRDEGVLALGAQAALAAHELATPLSAIAVTAHELAREFSGDPEIGRDCALLERQAAVCRDILDRLAARAQDSGRPQVHTLETWLTRLLVRWELLRPEARAELLLPLALRVRSVAVPDVLDQALLNLLNNAADVSPADVELAVVESATGLRLEILDRGPGFSPEAAAAAGRGRYSEKDGRGLGVGLTLTHSTVESLGGTVEVADRPGGGSIVAVQLPWETLTHDA